MTQYEEEVIRVLNPRKRRRSDQDFSERRRQKECFIQRLIAKGDSISKEDIRCLALSEGGLLSNEYRRVLWLDFLQVEQDESARECDITEFRDYSQVCLDVHRCNSRIPKESSETQATAIKTRLRNVIIKSLAEGPSRHYYQGYHDVSMTMLYVLGERLAARFMSKLCRSHLASHIRQNLDETSKQMKLVIPLVSQKCPELSDFIMASDAGTMFSLSWIITWFAYVIDDESTIYRLYDVFVTSPPLMPVYLSAAILLYRQQEILSVECELSTVHQVLHDLPQHLPFDILLRNANDLLTEYPPSLLRVLPTKSQEIILQVPRYGYLDWSRNWASKLLQFATTPAGKVVTSSFLIGFAAVAVSVIAGRYQT